MPDESSRETLIEARLQDTLQRPEFPALSRQIQEVLVGLQDEDASLSALANLVLREYSLTLKVLRTANSTHYNRSGTPLLSATHAMALIGARTVRDLATGLLLFDHFQKKSPVLKELMLLSMLTANHARELAIQWNYPRPEEAYLCGMYRNLGEVLIACYYDEDYTRILASMEENRRTAGEAALGVLGFRYEDLGAALARHWGMPNVGNAIQSLGTAGDPLGAITALSHELTTAVYRQEEADAPAALSQMLEKFGPVLNLGRDELGPILDAGIRETRETFSQVKVSLNDLRLRHQIEVALGTDAFGGTPADAPAGDGGGALETRLPAAARDRLASEVDSVLELDRGFDLHKVLLMVLESIYRAGPFDRVLFCLLNQAKTEIQGRFGLGASVDQVAARFRFPLTPRSGSLTLALVKRKDLFLAGVRDRHGADGEIARRLGAHSFGVFPVYVQGALVGCLYCDRVSSQAQPDAGAMAFLGRLRAQAERALEMRRLARPVAGSDTTTAEWSAEAKGEIVLRLLKGESVEILSRELGVAPEDLESWRESFLAGALARLRDQPGK